MWCHCYSGIVSCHAFLSFHLSDPRACQQLNADLIALDGEYNRLSDHVAKGERDDHSAESLNRVLLVRFFQKVCVPAQLLDLILNQSHGM